MEEIKNKIMGLINKQTPKMPLIGYSEANYHFNDAPILSINSKTVSEANRPADQDILESIEAAYFSLDENYDISRFELKKLPETLDCDQIQRDFKNLKQQHQVVSKKVLQLILENQNSSNEEFKHVTEILERVNGTLELCKSSRKHLNLVKREYQESLYVMANYKKKKLAQNLLNNLKMIKNLYNFDRRLNVLLNEGDYVGAILELQRCHRIANKYRHFTCVAALTYKLQETMENADSQLDKALAQTCLHFNGDYFAKLQEAFRLLEKPQSSVINNLHVHYISAIYNQSINVVQSYVSNPDILISNDGTDKDPYKTLCQSVPQDVFIPCLVDLCKVLFKIVLSYHQLISWLNNQENENASAGSPDRNRKLEKEKLEHNLLKIWDDVQRKVSSLLLNVDLARYKFDQFVQVLSVIHRLIQVGEEFCMSKSNDLLESIRIQSINYFKNYHAARLDELRIFFENEIWELCPVKSSFNVLKLQEFKSLRSLLRNFKTKPSAHTQNMTAYSSSSNDCCSSTHSQDGSSIYGNYFIRHACHGTPFDSGLDETVIDEDILADENDASGYFSEESDDESEDIKRDSEDENTKTPKKDKKEKNNYKAPILTNTTLSVLRQMGKYLQMSRLLRPIAYKIITCMNELFYYYLYVVHIFFASDLTISSNTLYSQQLHTTLKKVSDNMILHGPENLTGIEDDRVLKPTLSPLVDLKNSEHLNGLHERIVAVESLVYLASQFQALQEFMEYLIPQTNKYMLDQFFLQDVACAIDLRKPVYMAVCSQAFDLRQVLYMMSKVNWEVKDVMSQHNNYIDILLREVQIFTLRLEKMANKLPISSAVYQSLWENVAHIITHTLVQGFSEAKKCTNGGRALMQLDFTQFLSKFEKITGLKPVPHKSYVENYVKAYYLPEYELENWIKEHNEYSTKHFFGLVSCVCQNNKKTRQRLIQMIEDLEKNHLSDR